MPHAGQEIRGADGFALTLLTVEPELLAMEAAYPGNGRLPPEHLHPRQSERFEVLEGEIRAIVDGDERGYGAGESFEVPPGTRHQMTADSPARVRWEVRPALRTAEFFERLHGDGPGSARSGSIADFLAEFSEEIRFTGG
jgi:mannose-6-phosphate isomerase-like protein (cupin superfamily)